MRSCAAYATQRLCVSAGLSSTCALTATDCAGRTQSRRATSPWSPDDGAYVRCGGPCDGHSLGRDASGDRGSHRGTVRARLSASRWWDGYHLACPARMRALDTRVVYPYYPLTPFHLRF